MKKCKNCGSHQTLKPAFKAIGKTWCGHCGGRVVEVLEYLVMRNAG